MKAVSEKISRRQADVIGVLARDKAIRLVWAQCGRGAYGTGTDPTDRREKTNTQLILSIPVGARWPWGATIRALERRKLIRRLPRGPLHYFYFLYALTPAGRDVARRQMAAALPFARNARKESSR